MIDYKSRARLAVIITMRMLKDADTLKGLQDVNPERAKRIGKAAQRYVATSGIDTLTLHWQDIGTIAA